MDSSSLTRILKLGKRGLSAASGFTAPQEWIGGIHLLKNALTGNAKNVRLGEEGEVLYDNPSLDTPAAAMGSFMQTVPGGGDPDVLKHELEHVRQSDALGPAFMPAAIYEALGTEYGSGPMERGAIEYATPQSEMLRPGASMNKGPSNPLLQRLLSRMTAARR
jgi:hypothetical protein